MKFIPSFWLCHKEGHAEGHADMQTPSLKLPHQKVIVYGAQCSESNENVNKIFFRYLFFELSSKIGVIFSKNDTKMAITRKIKIGKI